MRTDDENRLDRKAFGNWQRLLVLIKLVVVRRARFRADNYSLILGHPLETSAWICYLFYRAHLVIIDKVWKRKNTGTNGRNCPLRQGQGGRRRKLWALQGWEGEIKDRKRKKAVGEENTLANVLSPVFSLLLYFILSFFLLLFYFLEVFHTCAN